MTQVTAVPRARRLLGPAVVLVGTAAAVAFIATVDPNEPGHYPTCPLLLTTGVYCPGCGSLRMINSLAHGQVIPAFGLNPLAFVLLPLFGYLWVRWTVLSTRGRSMGSLMLRPRWIYGFLGVVVAYWIVRNLPFGAALAP